MKTILSMAFILFVGMSFAQEPKVKKVSFKTSAICGMCEDRIEKALNYTKGVVYAELDVDTKMLTVKYKTKHLNSDQIKKIVAATGYDAGDVKKDTEAFNDLPKCCKTEGACHDKE